MAPKRKSVGTQPSPIEVRFISNESILWLPRLPVPSGVGSSHASTSLAAAPLLGNDDKGIGESQSSGDSSLPTTNEELKEHFVVFLRRTIRRLQGNPEDSDADYLGEGDKIRLAEKKKFYLALLAVALDPTSKLKTLSLEKAFEEGSDIQSLEEYYRLESLSLTSFLQDIAGAWAQGSDNTRTATKESREPEADALLEEEDAGDESLKPKRQDRGKGKSSVPRTSGRTTADENAQKTVPTWYRGRCILSGLIRPQGGHIVPVRAIKNQQPSVTWATLRCFWPLPVVKELVVKGREETNIFPLCPDAHALWDRYAFAIRPIEHPSDPQHRIYIQMVWLKDLDTDKGLVSGDWDHDGSGSIADFRRGVNGMYPPVRHGDVYEIVTADPDSRPLPSFRLLQIQYGVRKILAGMRAAGALEVIFSDDPPDDPGLIPFDVDVPPEWKSLLDAAIDAGVLDAAAAKRWGKAFMRDYIRMAHSAGLSLPRLSRSQALERESD